MEYHVHKVGLDLISNAVAGDSPLWRVRCVSLDSIQPLGLPKNEPFWEFPKQLQRVVFFLKMMFFDTFKIWARFDYPAIIPRSGQGKGTKWDPENETLTRGTQNQGEDNGQRENVPREIMVTAAPGKASDVDKVGRGQAGYCWSHFMTLYPKNPERFQSEQLKFS